MKLDNLLEAKIDDLQSFAAALEHAGSSGVKIDGDHVYAEYAVIALSTLVKNNLPFKLVCAKCKIIAIVRNLDFLTVTDTLLVSSVSLATKIPKLETVNTSKGYLKCLDIISARTTKAPLARRVSLKNSTVEFLDLSRCNVLHMKEAWVNQLDNMDVAHTVRLSDSIIAKNFYVGENVTNLDLNNCDLGTFRKSKAKNIVDIKCVNQLGFNSFEQLGQSNYVIVDDCDDLDSFKGLPEKMHELRISGCRHLERLDLSHVKKIQNLCLAKSNVNTGSLKNLPKTINLFDFPKMMTSLVDISDVDFIKSIFNIPSTITEGGLGLLLVNGLTRADGSFFVKNKAGQIIFNYLHKPEKVYECQTELIEANLEAFAEL